MKFFAVLLVCTMLLPGCSLFIRIRPCTFTTKNDDTQVQILGCKNPRENGSNQGLYSSSDIKDVEITNKKGKVVLNTFNDFYVVNQSKSGYISTSSIIARDKFNPIKAIDLLFPILSDLYLLSFIASTSTDASGNSVSPQPIFPGAGVIAYIDGTVGWLFLLLGPWKTFPSAYELPALQKFPYRDTSENRVYVREANISLEKYAFVNYYYKNYKDYLDGNEEYRATSNDEFKYRNATLKDTLNNLLGKWNFADTTTGHLGFMYSNGYYIKCDLTGAFLNTVKSISSFALNCDWKLFSTTSDKPAYAITLKTSSKWGFINSDDNTVNDYLKDAFIKGLAQFVSNPAVSLLLEQKTATADTIKSWNTVTLAGTDTIHTLQEAVKAVVTVKTPEGHGSGCILSSDGYFITNYHVISDNNGGDVEVIFSNGDTTMAEYIRSNAEYDLALFKIRKPGSYKCLHPSLSKDINIGSEVFAIGTPEDIELGQSLTKGIISGQRKVGEKQIIQTDVSINPGNSGGALVTKDGTLLGVVNAKLVGVSIQGIGFAIPAHYIQDALKVEFK